MNLLEQYNKNTVAKLAEGKVFPLFRAGDTLRVAIKIIEGNNERVQSFEGVCIGRKNAGIGSSFTVRKLSHNEGVERTFHLYSPKIEKVEIVKYGIVRRAKLYYMRNLRGKAARIKERMMHNVKNKKPVSQEAS